MQTQKTGLFIFVAFALTASANSAPMVSMHQAASEQFKRVRLELKENIPPQTGNIPVPAEVSQSRAEDSLTDVLVWKFKAVLDDLNSMKSDIRDLKRDLNRLKRKAEYILRNKKKDSFFSSGLRRAEYAMRDVESDFRKSRRDLEALVRDAVSSPELNRISRDIQYAVRDMDSRFRFDIEYATRRIESTVKSIDSADPSLLRPFDKSRARRLNRNARDAGRVLDNMEWPVRRLVSSTQ